MRDLRQDRNGLQADRNSELSPIDEKAARADRAWVAQGRALRIASGRGTEPPSAGTAKRGVKVGEFVSTPM